MDKDTFINISSRYRKNDSITLNELTALVDAFALDLGHKAEELSMLHILFNLPKLPELALTNAINHFDRKFNLKYLKSKEGFFITYIN